MKGLVKSVGVLRASLDEPTAQRVEHAEEALHQLAEQLSARCTALTVGARTEAASEGCRMVEESAAALLSCWQAVREQHKLQPLMLATARHCVLRVLDGVHVLASALVSTKTAASVNPGAGLLWSACDDLAKLRLTSSAAVAQLLLHAETAAADTAEEMLQLPVRDEEDEFNGDDDNDDDDDDDDGFGDKDDVLSQREKLAVDAAVRAIKAARGTFKGCRAVLLDFCKEKDVPLCEELEPLRLTLTKAVEDLGCSLYPPQEFGDVVNLTRAVGVAVQKLVDRMLLLVAGDEAQTQRVMKLANVSAMLCSDANSALEDISKGKF